eukprot:SAG11_NODE_762_length_7297_cov_8.442067_3_plen_177_part_00
MTLIQVRLAGGRAVCGDTPPPSRRSLDWGNFLRHEQQKRPGLARLGYYGRSIHLYSGVAAPGYKEERGADAVAKLHIYPRTQSRAAQGQGAADLRAGLAFELGEQRLGPHCLHRAPCPPPPPPTQGEEGGLRREQRGGGGGVGGGGLATDSADAATATGGTGGPPLSSSPSRPSIM